MSDEKKFKQNEMTEKEKRGTSTAGLGLNNGNGGKRGNDGSRRAT